jgi:ABC-type multidrug transport system ATPase subunit
MVELLADFRTWPVIGGGSRTILITTHQAALARPLADNILTMRNGQIADSARGDSQGQPEAAG